MTVLSPHTPSLQIELFVPLVCDRRDDLVRYPSTPRQPGADLEIAEHSPGQRAILILLIRFHRPPNCP